MKRGASWGLTALNQAREFHRLVSLTGLVITERGDRIEPNRMMICSPYFRRELPPGPGAGHVSLEFA